MIEHSYFLVDVINIKTQWDLYEKFLSVWGCTQAKCTTIGPARGAFWPCFGFTSEETVPKHLSKKIVYEIWSVRMPLRELITIFVMD